MLLNPSFSTPHHPSLMYHLVPPSPKIHDHTILSFSNPVSLSSAVQTVLLLALPPVSVIYPISSALPLPVVFISGLISGPAVAKESDVVCSYMTSEGCVEAGTATGAGTFGMEIYSQFPAVCSLQARDYVLVMITKKFSESFHHPEKWVHIRVPLLLRLSLVSQVLPLELLLPAPPPLSNLLRPLCFGAGISTQARGVVVHSPQSTRLYNSPDSARAPVSTSSRDVVLQLRRKTWTLLWIRSTMSAPKRRCPAKFLSY